MKIGEKGIQLIKHYEGLHDGNLQRIGLQPKRCPSGIWTVGWGHAIVYKGKFLKGLENEVLANELFKDLTIEQADQLFLTDIPVYENRVNAQNLIINQDQFDSLVSHTYNTGGSETLFKLIRTKAAPNIIYNWFTQRYIMGDGVVLPGLVYRRKTEAILFQTGVLEFYN